MTAAVLARPARSVLNVALADGGSTITWAEVAAELGYFDQSHFIRDFTAAVGMTPAAYADACRTHRAPVSA